MVPFFRQWIISGSAFLSTGMAKKTHLPQATDTDSTGVPAGSFSTVADPLNSPPQSIGLSGVSATGRCAQCTMSFETAWYQFMSPHLGPFGLYCAKMWYSPVTASWKGPFGSFIQFFSG